MEIGSKLQFKTPAKVNFFLYIQDRRPDGYHSLLMDLIPVSLYDRITIEIKSQGGITLKDNLAGVPTEDNLLYRSIKLLENKSGKKFSLDVNLQKCIPSGAGLGGGSGNAAGMLVVLNRCFQLGFSNSELKNLAVQLGADVPFFIDPMPSLAHGIGDDLTPLPTFEPLNLLLVYPGFPIATKYAYSVCNISGRKSVMSDYSIAAFDGYKSDTNDFWLPLSQEFPQLEECSRELTENGAVFCGLSGSGSTLFGIFKDNATRDKAYDGLKGNPDWGLFPCKTLQHHRYFQIPGQKQ